MLTIQAAANQTKDSKSKYILVGMPMAEFINSTQQSACWLISKQAYVNKVEKMLLSLVARKKLDITVRFKSLVGMDKSTDTIVYMLVCTKEYNNKK